LRRSARRTRRDDESDVNREVFSVSHQLVNTSLPVRMHGSPGLACDDIDFVCSVRWSLRVGVASRLDVKFGGRHLSPTFGVDCDTFK